MIGVRRPGDRPASVVIYSAPNTAAAKLMEIPYQGHQGRQKIHATRRIGDARERVEAFGFFRVFRRPTFRWQRTAPGNSSGKNGD